MDGLPMDALPIYARDGERISVERFSELFADPAYRIVRRDTVAGVGVSTVWIGIDHGFGMNAAPLIFETMTFTDRTLSWSERQWRYTTEWEAIAGHEAVCAEARVLLRPLTS